MHLDHLAMTKQSFVTLQQVASWLQSYEISNLKTGQPLHANIEGSRRDSHI